MWICRACGSTVDDDDFEVCWSCSRPRAGGDPVPSASDEAGQDTSQDEKIAVLATVQQGLGIVAANPIVLIGVVPLLAWEGFATIVGVPGSGFFEPQGDVGWPSQLVRDLVIVPMAAGLTMALVHACIRGAASLAAVLGALARRLPRLIVVAMLLNAPWLAAPSDTEGAAWEGSAFVLIIPPGLLVVVYLTFRLIFGDPAIVIDDLRVVDALRRSWALTRGNWWRAVALMLVSAPVFGLSFWLPTPVAVTTRHVTFVLMYAVLACAYLQRSGQLPSVGVAQSPLARQTLPST